ncbi:hypothetical protein Cob_v011410 [Colletotrichum orbiculare MAFF 240422]|uniref:MYND-type domain-containing protein n=1 Tax=Colletotrichum orbiculare (strain 104-T / ATCC 96160 / CBS 514.97 / LARS 414 / MAFF 240422) TaxID=1213857 RepID=N4V2X5_COLOR|nr:hypothetical protein Cob_v011410 [Colletotrichum orbiculare MAFF 240422]
MANATFNTPLLEFSDSDDSDSSDSEESNKYFAVHHPSLLQGVRSDWKGELCIMCENKVSDQHTCPCCQVAKYCSRKCQADDYSFHRRLCEPVRSALLTSRPSAYHLVLVFPCDKRSPQFVWIKSSVDEEHGALVFDISCDNIEDYAIEFPDAKVDMSPIDVDEALQYKSIPHGLDWINFQIPESKTIKWINKSLMSLGEPGYSTIIFAPTILWAYNIGENGEFLGSRDISLRDIRHLMDVLNQEPNSPAISLPSRFIDVNALVPALKINDLDHKWPQAMGITKRIESVTINVHNPLFDNLRVAKLFRIGLRWYVRNAQASHPQNSSEFHHEHEEFLHIFRYTLFMQLNEDSDNIAELLKELLFAEFNYTYSLSIFQANGNPIHPAHVQAVVEYYRLVDATRGMASEKAFRLFWDIYKRNQAKKGHPLTGVPSPYDLEDYDSAGIDAWSLHVLDVSRTRNFLPAIAQRQWNVDV